MKPMVPSSKERIVKLCFPLTGYADEHEACEAVFARDAIKLTSDAYRDGHAAAFDMPKGWRLSRLWNQGAAICDDNDWMAELQYGHEDRYVRNTRELVGHATPQEALAAACDIAEKEGGE